MQVRFCVSAARLPSGEPSPLCRAKVKNLAGPKRSPQIPYGRSETRVVVTVFLTEDGEQKEIGKSDFSVAEILRHESKTLSQELAGGSTIFVHAIENI